MNRKVFFDSIRKTVFNGQISQQQVDGLNHILDYYDKHYADKMSLNQFAYLLASIYHETAHTFQPIKEFGGSRMPYAPAFGRGLIQITHDRNYRAFGAIPYDKALEWDTALDIAFRGCSDGVFTGRKLSDYINSKKCDYTNARRVVNGTDRAALIAGYARSFKSALEAAAAAPAVSEPSAYVSVPPSKSIFDGLSDFFDWTKGESPVAQAPTQRTSPSPVGQIGYIACAIIAAIGALNQISGTEWETVISTPNHEGLNQILIAVALTVINAVAPPWIRWALPTPRFHK